MLAKLILLGQQKLSSKECVLWNRRDLSGLKPDTIFLNLDALAFRTKDWMLKPTNTNCILASFKLQFRAPSWMLHKFPLCWVIYCWLWWQTVMPRLLGCPPLMCGVYRDTVRIGWHLSLLHPYVTLLHTLVVPKALRLRVKFLRWDASLRNACEPA